MEADELTVDAANDEEGRFLVRASLCCMQRPVGPPTGPHGAEQQLHEQSITSIQDALKAVMEWTPSSADKSSAAVGGGIKRQRTTDLSSILEHRSI
ncbi:hypothetical protein Cni_G25668 [Canna indica]|uniref:Uncharacterized protein n=1 Tax=Canna indica TaxID=4628 RepID=A0AAQ3KYC3_9LILI|nr:hypothetical protein Cni_G25668 [Canna indica]